jgi:N-hydroxyarylamine O-acetyltransferase
LFYELLISIGFSARRVSARVFDKSNGYGQEFDHLAIIADIDGISYLTDVGFGEFSFSPLKLDTDIIQHDARGDFIIQRFEGDYFQVCKSENSILSPQYIFMTAGRELNEFEKMCHFHQTSPESHFTRSAMITRPTQEGRITLTQDTLKIRQGDSVSEVRIENEEDFRNMLWTYFAIELNADSKVVMKD